MKQYGGMCLVFAVVLSKVRTFQFTVTGCADILTTYVPLSESQRSSFDNTTLMVTSLRKWCAVRCYKDNDCIGYFLDSVGSCVRFMLEEGGTPLQQLANLYQDKLLVDQIKLYRTYYFWSKEEPLANLLTPSSDGVFLPIFYQNDSYVLIGKYKPSKQKAFFYDDGAQDYAPYKFLSKTEDFPTVWKATHGGQTPGVKAVVGAIDAEGHKIFIAERDIPACNGYHIGSYKPEVEACAHIACASNDQCYTDFNILYIVV